MSMILQGIIYVNSRLTNAIMLIGDFIAFLPITDNTDMGISVPILIPMSISVHP